MIKFNEDYHRHIVHPHDVKYPGKTICGENAIGWCYVDINHAFISAPRDCIQPCPKCVAMILDVFNKCE